MILQTLNIPIHQHCQCRIFYGFNINMKYYVVWKGHQPGIYTNWQDTQQQVHGYT